MAQARWILFDWGNTLMRVFPDFPGPMKDWPRVEALDGAEAILAELHGTFGIALATNAADSTEPEIRQALARVDLDRYVDRIFCFRAVGAKKSTPAFFQHVLQKLGARPEDVVMVGDEWDQDVAAPRRHGIRAVWLDEGRSGPQPGTDFRTIHALRELPGALEGWCGTGRSEGRSGGIG